MVRVNVLHAPADVETMHPQDVLRWTFDTHGVENVVVTVSFEDAVLAHLAHTANPAADIVLLDTQYLFAETLWYVEELRRRFDLQVRVVRPLEHVVPDNRWQTDVEGCCFSRKVEPLQRAMAGKAAWVTGVRRVDGPTRATTPVVSFDVGRNIVKVNPMATWTDDDMALYAELNELPANPLTERGYPSIGCWPCTRPVAPGEDKRGGRWSGLSKTECGLHT
jgi:phosphoadenosine phosphosulfate reductase